MESNEEKYDDIINLPHHVSERHPRMSMAGRAAQFSSFAALSGYDDAVRETARVVEDSDTQTYDSDGDFPDFERD